MPCSKKQPKLYRTSKFRKPRHCNGEAARYYVNRERVNLELRTKLKNLRIFTVPNASSICVRANTRTWSNYGKSFCPKTTLASFESCTGWQSLISTDSGMNPQKRRCEGRCP